MGVEGKEGRKISKYYLRFDHNYGNIPFTHAHSGVVDLSSI